jgi:ABC-type bacteriocin/lantibiotic exporter with double-glycine peptidase domain
MMALLTIVVSVQFSASYQKRKAHSMEKTDRHLQSATMAGILSMETIKSAGAEQGFYQRWDAIYTEALNARVVATRQMIWISAIPILVLHMSNALLLCLGTWFILRGELTAGMLLASQGFMSSMFYPVTRLTTVIQEVFKAHSVLERQEEVLDVKPVVEDGKDVVNAFEAGETITKLTGDIELRDVTFGYDRSQPPLISHLSLHIKAGEQVAFVGKSGCGKSTIAMLIAGLYEPWEGEVLIDGKPVSEIDRMTMTGSLGFVGQDITLFEGTVAENIRMWDKSIEDFAMVTAAANAQLHEEIACRAGAYNSKVSKGGQNFSGGQRQRLEIATALAKEPTLLLMDEATSALDITTETKVMEAVRNLGVTLILIAHRMETVRPCHRIYVMDYGQLVQCGNHEELMADQKGIYYELNKS